MIEYKVQVYTNGNKEWRFNGKLHRKDGPAVEFLDGDKYWWSNDKLHREDGPAVEYASGTKVWFLNGKYHREDGPAIECSNGHKEWYLNGEPLTEEDFNNRHNVELTLEEIANKFNIPLDKLRIKK